MATPKLRFKEFDGDWSTNKIEEISIVTSGGTPSRNVSDYWNGDIPWVTTSLVDFNVINEAEEFITQVGLDNSSAKLFHKDTILMAMYGQGITRGKVAILGIDATTNQACAAIKLKNGFETKFIFQNLMNRYEEIRDLSNEGGQKNLSAGIIKEILISFPEKEEQTKIASFLSNVDEKISQLTQKHQLLSQYKQGMMQKLFSQQIRFKADDGSEFGEWENISVKEIFDVTRGQVLAVSNTVSVADADYKYPVFSSQTKQKGLMGFYKKYLFEDALTWTTDGANAGDVNFRKGKFYCTNVCGVLLSQKGYANLCIAEILNKVTHKYVSYVGNPKLMNNVMSEIPITIPINLEEQTKIANFLSSIDQKIEVVAQQIEQAKQWKKGLLQNLFI